MQRCQLFCLIIKEYISRWIHTSNKALTLSWRRSLSYRNQSIDLLCKSGFFMIKTSVMKELRRPSLIILRKSILTCHKAELAFFVFLFFLFFSSEFSSRISWFTGHQGKGETISLTPPYHFHPLYRHLDISQVIFAESSPLRIASSRSQTRNLWFPIGSR